MPELTFVDPWEQKRAGRIRPALAPRKSGAVRGEGALGGQVATDAAPTGMMRQGIRFGMRNRDHTLRRGGTCHARALLEPLAGHDAY